MEKKVIGIGNVLVDVLVEGVEDQLIDEMELEKGNMTVVDKNFIEKWVKELKKRGYNIRYISGGSAANTMKGLGILVEGDLKSIGDSEVGFIGRRGLDEYGSKFEDDLISSGVHTKMDFIEGNDGTGVALTLVGTDGERTFGTYLGVNGGEIAGLNIDWKKRIAGYDYVYTEMYMLSSSATLLTILEEAKNQNIDVIIDLSSHGIVKANHELVKSIIKNYADIVFANKEEALAYAKTTDIMNAVDILAEDTWIAVVKDGENGSIIKNNHTKYDIDIIDTQCVDTTGAGDFYAAGFIYGLLNQMPLNLAGKIGSLMASRVISRVGTKIDISEWQSIRDDIKKLVLHNYK